MNVTDLSWKTSASDLAAAFRAGNLLPSEALEAILGRIDATNSIINAFAHLDIDAARAQARAADARFAAGAPLGRFDGVPLSIKDNITVKGMPCRWGSALFKDFVAERDETPVARLRAQGAVILGKTNVSEFTLGRGNINTALFGVTRNPWDPALTPGASSGGAAAAVAAGMGPLALGTDGGGSIRRPAAYCGLVGLKPTTGRVARVHGLPIILHDAEVIGPLARTVDDIAMALTAIQGPGAYYPQDRLSLRFDPTEGEMAAPRALRILFVPQFGKWQVEDAIAAGCAEAARRWRALGHRVEEGTLPVALSLFEDSWPSLGAAGLAWLVKDMDWQGKVGPMHAEMIQRGQTLSAVQYLDILTAFREISLQFSQFFADYDLMMTPSSGAMPWQAEIDGPAHHRAFTGIINAAGLPAINLPTQPDANGLPVGFQLIAPFGRDWDLIALARQYEAAFPWREAWPAL